jgi:hypothetical protein
MKDWEVVIDTRNRMHSLKDPLGKGMFQVPLPQRTDLASTSCATQVTPLHEIPVV